MPFWEGEDKSRTLLLTLHKKQGLLIKHDHRHPDGTPEAITMYGGYATTRGTALTQSFPADAFTGQLIPGNDTRVWAMQFSPDKKHLTYTFQVNNILVYQFDFKLD